MKQPKSITPKQGLTEFQESLKKGSSEPSQEYRIRVGGSMCTGLVMGLSASAYTGSVSVGFFVWAIVIWLGMVR